MKRYKLREIAEACGGALLSGDPEREASHVSIDSREIREGSLFVPLVGEKVDAHRFLPEVREKGACGALISDESAAGGLLGGEFGLIKVRDTLSALQALSSVRRSSLSCPLIAVTGSVGKTTTREMIAAALSAGKRVYRTPKNHNGQIGVPLTLLEAGDDFDAAVIEMGISLPGEMSRISRLARPDAAVFTNIGYSHIEQLKTQENILREKLCIQEGMPEGAAVFLNGDDPLLKRCALRKGFRRILYGRGENCENRAEQVSLRDGRACFTASIGGERIPVSLRVFGEHQVLNAMAALSVAAFFGTELRAAAEKLSEFSGFPHRQQLSLTGGVTLVDDSYNASPSSMRAALDILGSMAGARRRIAVLADMKELGEEAVPLHREIGSYLAGHRSADILLTLGELAEEIAGAARGCPGAPETRSFRELGELEAALGALLKPGDAVLLKGSNSMGLTALADRMKGEGA